MIPARQFFYHVFFSNGNPVVGNPEIKQSEVGKFLKKILRTFSGEITLGVLILVES